MNTYTDANNDTGPEANANTNTNINSNTNTDADSNACARMDVTWGLQSTREPPICCSSGLRKQEAGNILGHIGPY